MANKRRLFIITGTSRGIGEALAGYLSNKNNLIVGLSRSKNESLQKLFEHREGQYLHFHLDLRYPETIASVCQEVFSQIDPEKFLSITLINNAGMLEPIDQIADANIQQMIHHIQVNLTSTMVLSSLFLKRVQHMAVEKEILFLSSGAAKNPYSGWSAYCSSKAGVGMFARVLHQEQTNQQYPAKVVTIAPGVVETTMQKTIRTKNEHQFPAIDKFIKLKDNDQLYTVEYVATTMGEKILNNASVESGDDIDLRKL